MKVVETDGFVFRFEDAIDAFVFDEQDKSKPTFHGAPMKGVDIVVELEDKYLYIELKDYDDPSIYDISKISTEDDEKAIQDGFTWLKRYLKYKFRDTYLYRHAEGKVEKPVVYFCLTTFDNALNSIMQKQLKKELPVGKVSPRWVKAIAKSCFVMNPQKWNENFPRWPVTRSENDPGSGGNE